MENQNKTRNIFLAILFIVAIGLGVLTNSYLITGMYILTILAAVYIIKDKDIYNLLYATLLVSLFYDYTLHVPKIESIYFFHIVLGIFTLLSLYKVFKDRDILAKLDKKIVIFFVIWFIYMCMSVAWALSKGLAIKYIAIYIMMFAFIVDMMIYNISKERLKETIKLLLLLVSFIILVGFVEVLLGKQLPVRHYIDGFMKSLPQWQINTIKARPIAFSYNTNNLTATLAILSPLCFFAIYKFENILAKIWFTLISCIGFTLVVITTSRTGFYAFLVGFGVFIIYSIFNMKNLGIKQMVFPIIIIAGFFLAYNYGQLIMNIEPVKDGEIHYTTSLSGKLHSLEGFVEGEGSDEGSTLHRMEIINNVLNGVIREKHFQGYGVGNVEQFLKNRGNSGSIYSPHCYAIEILGDFGIVGIALYGIYYLYLLVGNFIIGIKKRSRICFATVSGLIAFAPASFGPSSITYVLSYWVLMGFAISCIQVYKSEDTSSVPGKIKEFHF
ncbi:hypothetical protein UT300005_12760 [Clostridium sp. CTA-5]